MAANELVITANPDGSVSVRGPIGNKLLAYAMLEMARDAIKDYKPEAIEIPKLESRGVLLNGQHRG